MKIALLKNTNISYGSLAYFSSCIESALRNHGIQTETVTKIDGKLLTTKWDAVIGINQAALSTQLSGGRFVFDYLNCPLFAFIVDPPYHHGQLLREHPRNLHLICLDTGHIEYSHKFYGPFQSVHMGYLLGPVADIIPYEERGIDVLFMGTRASEGEIQSKVSALSDEWMKEAYEYLICKAQEMPNASMAFLAKEFFKDSGKEVSDESYRNLMETVGGYAEFYLRGLYREKILSLLVDAGVNLTVAGMGWEAFFQNRPRNLTLLGNVDFARSGEMMANAKVCLNVMPWFKDGIHDRILSSMYNETVCVTDESSYIKEHFEDGQNLLLYDLKKLEMLPEKIKNLLENPGEAGRIIKNAKRKVQGEYTWEKLVDRVILPYLE